MHLEVLVEDKSGSIVVRHLLHKIKDALNHETFSFNIHPYKGIGKLPAGLKSSTEPRKRILLDQLPRLLQGYGRSLRGYGAVAVIVDSDDKDCAELKKELNEILQNCDPKPTAVFCIAVEEIEAWLLGDKHAVLQAYPHAKKNILDEYNQDSICGTWEVLADSLCAEKAIGLKKLGIFEIGKRKIDWANHITPLIDLERNQSPSFQYFVRKITTLIS